MAIPAHHSLAENQYRTNALGFVGPTPGGGVPVLDWVTPHKDGHTTNTVYLSDQIHIFQDKIYYFDHRGIKRGWLRRLDLATGAVDWETDLEYKIDEGTSTPPCSTLGSVYACHWGADNGGSYHGFEAVTATHIYMRWWGMFTDVWDWAEHYHPRVWCFDTADGTFRWISEDLMVVLPEWANDSTITRRGGQHAAMECLVVDNNDLIVCTPFGFCRLDGSDGSVQWAYDKNTGAPWRYSTGTGQYENATPVVMLLRNDTEFMVMSPNSASNGAGGLIYDVATGAYLRQIDGHKMGGVGGYPPYSVYPDAAGPMAHQNNNIVVGPMTGLTRRDTYWQGQNPSIDAAHVAVHATANPGTATWRNRNLAACLHQGMTVAANNDIYGLSNMGTYPTKGNHHYPVRLDIATGAEVARASVGMWPDPPQDATGQQDYDDPTFIPCMRSWCRSDDNSNIYMWAYPANDLQLAENFYSRYPNSGPWGSQYEPFLNCYDEDLVLAWQLSVETTHQTTHPFGVAINELKQGPAIGRHTGTGDTYVIMWKGTGIEAYRQGATPPSRPPGGKVKQELSTP